jgi:hypothetical protein
MKEQSKLKITNLNQRWSLGGKMEPLESSDQRQEAKNTNRKTKTRNKNGKNDEFSLKY